MGTEVCSRQLDRTFLSFKLPWLLLKVSLKFTDQAGGIGMRALIWGWSPSCSDITPVGDDALVDFPCPFSSAALSPVFPDSKQQLTTHDSAVLSSFGGSPNCYVSCRTNYGWVPITHPLNR